MMLLALLAAAAPVIAAPATGDLKTFGDWTVACDNVRHCTMASLGPEAGEFPNATLAVAREAGPAGGYTITVAVEDGAPAAALIVDGARFALAPNGLSGAPAAAVAAAIAQGRTLAVRDARGRGLGMVSLRGAAAAVRYIDAAQARAGTVTATVATGPRPAGAVPAAPPVPVVTALTPGGPVASPGAAQLAAMRRLAQCDPPAGGMAWTSETAALGGGATLVILPCSMGAYNVIGALFVIRGGRAVPVETDAPAGFEETGADSRTPIHSVVNGTFGGGLLTSYAKARGLGDCGVTQGFAWDGRRFRLVQEAAMGECRGNRDYVRTWHARVVRR